MTRCLVCLMHEPGGACTELPAGAFASGFLMALYMPIANRSNPATEMALFLGTLCGTHHQYAMGFLQALIDDEGDAVVRIALVKLHDAQTRARDSS